MILLWLMGGLYVIALPLTAYLFLTTIRAIASYERSLNEEEARRHT